MEVGNGFYTAGEEVDVRSPSRVEEDRISSQNEEWMNEEQKGEDVLVHILVDRMAWEVAV